MTTSDQRVARLSVVDSQRNSIDGLIEQEFYHWKNGKTEQEVIGLATSPRNLVREIRKRLQQEIGCERYELWFGTDGLLSVNGKTMVVTTSDQFSMDRIKSHYADELHRLVDQVGLSDLEYRCESPASIGSNNTVDTDSSLPINSSLGMKTSKKKVSQSESLDACKSSSGLGMAKVGVSGAGDGGNGHESAGTELPPIQHSMAESFADTHSPHQKSPNQCSPVGETRGSKPPRRLNPAIHAAGCRTRKSSKNNLNNKLFSEFVVDPENELCWQACMQTLKAPGELNPLYLYGNSGCGKTHLLEGIFFESKRRIRNAKVQCMTAEKFTSDFVGSLKNRSMPMFRKRYRELDFFLLDDVQFLEGKQSTLVELQHTIEAVVKRSGQVVLTADRSPTELEFAGPEFINRVSCGLSCQVSAPSTSSKLIIVGQMAKSRNVNVRKEVQEYIAAEVGGDVRLLSGAINRIKALQIVNSASVGLSDAKRHLSDLVGISRKSVSMNEIENVVCSVFGLDRKCLRSASKVKSISQPRMLAMWLSRKYTRAALSEIGDFFGGRSHSTVISAHSKVEKWVERGDVIGLRHSEFPVENALRRIEHQLRVG